MIDGTCGKRASINWEKASVGSWQASSFSLHVDNKEELLVLQCRHVSLELFILLLALQV